MRLHADSLFTSDPTGRLLRAREPGGARAPRFYLGRSSHEDLWRFRDDLSRLAGKERPLGLDLVPPERLTALSRVVVAAAGGGSATLTASDGSWRLPLLAVPVTLEFSEFAYESETTTATIPPGGSATLSVALAPLARVNISGIVLG